MFARWLPVLGLLALGLGHATPAFAQGKGKGKSYDEVVDAAVAYLKSTQAEDGTWSKNVHPGLTAVVLVGLFDSGKITADDPIAVKALKYIESLVDAKEGHIANGEKIFHKNYVTSVNILALKGSSSKKYDAVIARAVDYLKSVQIDESEEKQTDDLQYGGFGYGPGTRPDMSNTNLALDALKSTGMKAGDPVFKKAAVFASRCQNLKSESNTQPWAGKLNDGSFIYVLAAGKGPEKAADEARPGYGSMTFAGVKTLALAGVGKDDPRMVKAMEWVAKNYSVDYNPGLVAGDGGKGYFYYMEAMARCFETLGVDSIKGPDGKDHNWRADITRALINRQMPDGSWRNPFPTWLESNADLCTAFALTALAHSRPAK